MGKNKISIIIPCYGTEKYLDRCINSVINQTYKNLEIIVVNDCSPDNTEKIIRKYKDIDKRIKIINHNKNKGLFLARMSGAKKATGDYIAFLDSDDYVDHDFYRELLSTMELEKSDMVICNTVKETASGEKYIYNLFKTGKNNLTGQEILDEYFKQEGKNYRWHTVWNKLYRMDLWKKCESYYENMKEHLIMTEDFVFSTILFSFAKKLSYNDCANYFYCENDVASTSLININYNKCKKNITDLIKSFNYVEEFLNKRKIYSKYKIYFKNWKSLYSKMWYDNVVNANFEEELKQELINKLLDFDKSFLSMDFTTKDNFYNVATKWNSGLVEVKEKIINNDIISFDIFDTLILRPLYAPKDLFRFLNTKFNELFDYSGLIEFSKIREESEFNCRDINYKKGVSEVTLDEIYSYIALTYKLDLDKVNILKNIEIELEKRFCYKRETGFSLYKLAKTLNKKIIYTSDMYLPYDVIKQILENNGYEVKDNLYLSCSLEKTKSKGNLYKYLIDKNIMKSNITLHIGDNVHSDFEIPKNYKINSIHFPKAMDIFLNYFPNKNKTNYCGEVYKNFELLNIDHSNFIEFLGNRCSLAVVANKFFDNPFVSFNENTDFNCDPYMIGFYNLGMHIFTLVKWILDSSSKQKYDSICFMARDGYLPYLAAKELFDLYSSNTKLNYVYLSRKSLLPLTLREFKDFYKIKEYFNLQYASIDSILQNLKSILKLPKNYKEIIEVNGFKMEQKIAHYDSFNKFLNILYNEFYDKKKYEENYAHALKYFNNNFIGKTATFDIGYSGQPELILSSLMEKKIDTYFIHANNENAFNNATKSGYKLNLFYQYKPTFTGTLREYLISSNEGSCVGYKNEKGILKPILEQAEIYDYFDIKMLDELHSGCLSFVREMKEKFGDYLFEIDFNNYYMSLPFEYFLHYSKMLDRQIFNGLEFEQNIDEKININNFWNERIDEYNEICNKYTENLLENQISKRWQYNQFLEERVHNRNFVVKLIFYCIYDRVALRHKMKNRLNNEGLLYRGFRKIYHLIKK